MPRINTLADKLLEGSRNQGVNLGALRRARSFDINNYEALANALAGRVTSDKSRQLSVAQAAGFSTQGLIVGGQRDTRDTRGEFGDRPSRTTSAQSSAQSSTRATTTTHTGNGGRTTRPSDDGLTDAERRLLARGGDL